MAYQHIENLYKNTTILTFKECYAMEKIHGTSAHISYKNGRVAFFSGGEKYETFIKLFDADQLKNKFDEMVNFGAEGKSIHIYGEAYGGGCQRMSHTYGDKLKFIAFEVKIGDTWLNVPKAESICKELGIEFVHYVRITTDLASIDAERDADSVQAVRNGAGSGKTREGVVLRPIEETISEHGNRIVAKHKGAKFQETKTTREVNPEKLKIIAEAKEVAEEWVTEMRLTHILDKIESRVENMGNIIKAMCNDVQREGEGEIVWSPQVQKEIGSRTAQLAKKRFSNV